MRSKSIVAICALMATLLAFAVGPDGASATVKSPMWVTRGEPEEVANPLKKGESREVTLETGSTLLLFHESGAIRIEITCKGGSGSGSIIGGEPGTGLVTMHMTECLIILPLNCKLASSTLTLEKIEAELMVLKDEKTLTYRLHNIADKKFLELVGAGCPVGGPGGSQWLLGSIASSLPSEKFTHVTSLTFPEAPLEDSSLEWALGRKVTFKSSDTMKLTNGKELEATL